MTAIAVTIAGSDSGGGAGIQADLKTFSALGVYGATVITAVTAQNTRGVTAVEDISPAVVTAQIDALFSDLAVGAVKVGMVSRQETIAAIASGLKQYGHLAVIDPVMVATSGDILLRPDAIAMLKGELLPLGLIVTPNLPEAALMTGCSVAENETEMGRQAQMLLKLGARAVLMKGGHAKGDEAVDILFNGDTSCACRDPGSRQGTIMELAARYLPRSRLVSPVAAPSRRRLSPPRPICMRRLLLHRRSKSGRGGDRFITSISGGARAVINSIPALGAGSTIQVDV